MNVRSGWDSGSVKNNDPSWMDILALNGFNIVRGFQMKKIDFTMALFRRLTYGVPGDYSFNE